MSFVTFDRVPRKSFASCWPKGFDRFASLPRITSETSASLLYAMLHRSGRSLAGKGETRGGRGSPRTRNIAPRMRHARRFHLLTAWREWKEQKLPRRTWNARSWKCKPSYQWCTGNNRLLGLRIQFYFSINAVRHSNGGSNTFLWSSFSRWILRGFTILENMSWEWNSRTKFLLFIIYLYNIFIIFGTLRFAKYRRFKTFMHRAFNVSVCFYFRILWYSEMSV